MVHPFQCRCGTVRGEVDEPRRAMRAVCYCRDCRAYAHWLGHPGQVLDPLGGTDIVATHARYVRLTAGTSALACMSLSPRGLLRWYASCCNTPVGNTSRSGKLPYVGLVHSCLAQVRPLEPAFPPVQMDINRQSALGPAPSRGGAAVMARFLAKMLRLAAARLTGSWRRSPFFDRAGHPVVPVHVPPKAEVEAARRAAG
ncbi:hypothetical protein GCM10027034_34520 [Ramlibacter solisilvae]|uniref:CENP-V/GFA domain-containing protein n=1 Tax=Ramlibacter tataouinensis TaxID=94132 RepID=A0A127JSK0_9BURK|nr:DUF6151 family protein [Ramlibacter tataouinensis]AMO22937.1 hypothetical protein UC35_08625 [Ramlibacter tataouinensis]